MTADPILCVYGVRKTYGAGPAPVRAVARQRSGCRPGRAQTRTRRADSGSARRPELVVRMTALGERRLRLPGQALARSTGRRPIIRPNVIG
jgi:hypothetical protein